MKAFVLSILLILAPSFCLAQDHIFKPLPTQGERRAASAVSWVTVGTLVALDVQHAWREDERAHALQMVGCRLFVTYGLASITKTVTQRERPDGSDYESFYSGHSAMAFQTLGGPRLAVALPLAVSTAGLRVAAGKHWLTDVLVGAGVGALTSRIR